MACCVCDTRPGLDTAPSSNLPMMRSTWGSWPWRRDPSWLWSWPTPLQEPASGIQCPADDLSMPRQYNAQYNKPLHHYSLSKASCKSLSSTKKEFIISSLISLHIKMCNKSFAWSWNVKYFPVCITFLNLWHMEIVLLHNLQMLNTLGSTKKKK